MVDEYQDITAQFELLTLAKEHQNICVVGDDDSQFMAGEELMYLIFLILKILFLVAVYTLEKNYRSSEILDAAAVVKNNDRRANKNSSKWSR